MFSSGFVWFFSELANQSTNEIFLEVPQKKLIHPEFMIMIMSEGPLDLGGSFDCAATNSIQLKNYKNSSWYRRVVGSRVWSRFDK